MNPFETARAPAPYELSPAFEGADFSICWAPGVQLVCWHRPMTTAIFAQAEPVFRSLVERSSGPLGLLIISRVPSPPTPETAERMMAFMKEAGSRVCASAHVFPWLGESAARMRGSILSMAGTLRGPMRFFHCIDEGAGWLDAQLKVAGVVAADVDVRAGLIAAAKRYERHAEAQLR